MKTAKLAIFIILIISSFNIHAMSPWDHFELGLGYVESELENTDKNNVFNYGGQFYNFAYNHLTKVNKNWHHYYGLNLHYISKNNNADNNLMSEKATHISPGIHYKLYYKNIFANIGYNYTMAEHEGAGQRTNNLDFDIHKASIKVGYDYPITNNLYLMGAYNFGYGLVDGFDDDHIYSEHIFSLNLIIKFGEKSPGSSSTSGKESSSSRGGQNYESIKVDKRNSLYDFFIVTD